MIDPNETPHEPRFSKNGEDLNDLLSEWRDLGRCCLKEVEDFTREHPAASLAVSFLAGTFFGSFLRRR